MAHQYFTDTTSIFNSLISDTIIDHHPNTTNNFFPLLNPAAEVLDTTPTSCWDNIHTIMGFSQDSFFTHDNTSQFNTNSSANMPCFPSVKEKNVVNAPVVEPMVSTANARVYDHVGNKKRKSSLETPESSSLAYSSPPDSENGVITLKNSAGGKGKKQKCNGKNEEEEEKPKDVVHVRARRGQATDSHSLAERVRRGKINERLRCLQDIVPGCHKTVGMAAMLDEIINYVQSLQNQVEFLSMKLTAASNFHDFNAETDTMNMMIQRAKALETTIMMQKLLRDERFEEVGDEYGGFGFPSSTNQHGPFDHSFGCYPSLPNNNNNK